MYPTVTYLTTPGGVKVAAMDIPTRSSFYVLVHVRGGAAVERPEEVGAAYLLQGLLSRRTARLPEPYGPATYFGVRGGQVGVSATFQELAVTAVVPAYHREAVGHALDIVGSPGFTAEDVEEEVQYSAAEHYRRWSYPALQCHMAAAQRLFGAGHRAVSPLEGDAKQIGVLTPEILRAYLDRVVVRENVTVWLEGPVDVHDLAWIDHHLDGLPTGAPIAHAPIDGHPSGAVRIAVNDETTPNVKLQWIVAGPARPLEGYAAPATQILAGGGPGNGAVGCLIHLLQAQSPLIYDLTQYSVQVGGRTAQVIEAICPQHTAAHVEQIVPSFFANAAANGVPPAMVEAFRAHILGTWAIGIDAPGAVQGLAMLYGAGRQLQLSDVHAYQEGITPERINETLATYWRPENVIYTAVGPDVEPPEQAAGDGSA